MVSRPVLQIINSGTPSRGPLFRGKLPLMGVLINSANIPSGAKARRFSPVCGGIEVPPYQNIGLSQRFLSAFGLALMLAVACQGCKSSAPAAASADPTTAATSAPAQSSNPAAAPDSSGVANDSAAPSNYSNVSYSNPPAASASGAQQVWLGDAAIGMPNAMSMTIPTGWHFQGGIVRNVSCSPGDAFPQLVVSSADGAYSLTIMTPFFTTSMPTNFNLQGCGTVTQPTTAANILTHYVAPALRKAAQISAPQAAPGWETFLRAASPPSTV